ncbi:MAG: hypothetical protein PHP83_01260 [Clostridia bacterium]|nr:hypothetical protein [Clostridia bacterium]
MKNYIMAIYDEHVAKSCMKKMWQISQQIDNCLETMRVLKENDNNADFEEILIEAVSLAKDFNNKLDSLKKVDLEVWQKNGNRIKNRVCLTLIGIRDEYKQLKLLDNQNMQRA